MRRDREQLIAFPHVGGPLEKEHADGTMDLCPFHVTEQTECCLPDTVVREAIPHISEMLGYILEECRAIASRTGRTDTLRRRER